MDQDPKLTVAYLVVDSLDECEAELPELLDLITWTLSAQRTHELDENFQIFCDNLVYFDKDNNTVGLIHQSTKEYPNEYLISRSAMGIRLAYDYVYAAQRKR